MSPIIYTPQYCELPHPKTVTGTLWQCPDCDKVWELNYIASRDTSIRAREWSLKKDPRRDSALAAAAEAVLDAWRVPGPFPAMHEAAKREVRKSFPYLAARLDEACDTRG